MSSSLMDTGASKSPGLMRLAVAEGHEIAYSVHGLQDGEPAIVLHGGPGSGRSTRGLSRGRRG